MSQLGACVDCFILGRWVAGPHHNLCDPSKIVDPWFQQSNKVFYLNPI